MKFAPSDALDQERWSDALANDEESAAFDGLPGRFCMFYQPDLDLHGGGLGACEALLRWWHPEYGMLRPDASLRGTRWNAEIADIEGWAMDAVCRQSASWDREGVGIQVALNVSRPHLASEGFLDAVDRAVTDNDLDPAKLAIDVPVGALALDQPLLTEVTSGIADRGIHVIIDGVDGAAGLPVLDEIDASVWKIDLWAKARRRPGMHPSVTAALRRADGLGVTTVAKAVEDAQTLEAVRDLGFDRAFGHAVSPAVTREAMSALLRRPGR